VTDYYRHPADPYGDPLALDGLDVGPIRRDNDGRYVWTVTVGGERWTYCTDRAGDGLWRGTDQSGRQLVGHAQWTVRGVARSTRRRRVVRMMLWWHQ
jgi:hypothetical protein